MLATAKRGNAVKDVAWHGKRGPAVAGDPFTGDEAHEVVSALCIASGPETDSAEGTRGHAVVMLFMSLDIRAKLKANVFRVVDFLTKDKKAWGMNRRDAVLMREGIEPEHGIAHKVVHN